MDGLVPVFLHHLGHDRLMDSPGVESQVAGSLVPRSAYHLLHLFLNHLVAMAVLLAIGLLPHSKDTLTSLPSVDSGMALEDLLRPVSLGIHDEALMKIVELIILLEKPC